MASSLPPVRTPPRALLRLLCVLVLALAACADEEPAASPEPEGFSGADINFLQGMILQNEQAVEMADVVPDRTEREELIGFAEGIAAQQSAEVSEMEELLERSGGQPPDAPAAGDEHDDAGPVLADDELTDLRGLDGTPFDLTFLDRMLGLHRGAIADAEEALDRVEHPEVRALAERIISEREPEVEQMDRWRDEWDADEGG